MRGNCMYRFDFCRQTTTNFAKILYMKHRGWIIFSGVLWFVIGSRLLYKGLQFLSETPREMATLLLAIGLLIGFFKGRFVFVKSVRKTVLRIVSLPLPIRLKDVYVPSYYILILAMMGLGIALRFLPISSAARGTIDVAIGSALLNGALLYFRSAIAYGKNFPSQSR